MGRAMLLFFGVLGFWCHLRRVQWAMLRAKGSSKGIVERVIMLIILLPLPGIQCYSASDVAVLWCVGVLVSSQACSMGRAACEEGSSKGIVERVIILIILLPRPGIQSH